MLLTPKDDLTHKNLTTAQIQRKRRVILTTPTLILVAGPSHPENRTPPEIASY